MSMPTVAAVRACLKTVMDPELNIDIVSLGLIYGVEITPKNEVRIELTLTTPGCPLAGTFEGMITSALAPLASEEYDVEAQTRISLTFDPPWVPDMMSEEARAELGWD
jgi:metal-sulfur cluster biosynthetic enzyme